jgi:two-component system, cell cycle sensor histidine kinase and response regulator CckA
LIDPVFIRALVVIIDWSMGEADFRVAHEWLRAFAEITENLLCVVRVDPSGEPVLEWGSDTFVAVTGYTIEECAALPSWLELILESERSIAMDQLRVLLSGKDTESETQIRCKQGNVRRVHVHARPIWNADHAHVEFVCVAARDVTDQRRAEAALQEAVTLNNQILTGSHEGIIVVDRERRYRFWNPQMERLTGVPKEKVLGRTPWDLFPFLRESGLDDLLERVLAGEQVTSPDFAYHVPSTGQAGWSVQKMGPLRDRFGNVVAALVFVEDVTDRKRGEVEREKLRAQLMQSQKMEAIGSLAGGVAHDFNNLLAVILALSEAALSRMNDKDPLWQALSEIRKAGERGAALTRQLLAFSRKQVLHTTPVDLSSVVRGVEPMLQRVLGSHIELVTSLAPHLGVVVADAGQMELVLINLVVNARDAMVAGGRITIETANVDRHGPCVLLSVTDTGSGMDEATRARCFEPFFTTKAMGKGTGLGLATTYGIVRQSGGEIEVTSELGKGSTFTIYLPQVVGIAAAKAAPPPAVARAHGETVLVVEDERAMLVVLTSILEGAGYVVLAANNGAEALRISSEHKGAIDLVMTDVVMPQMSGQSVVQQLKQQRPSVRVIFMSGYAEDAVASGGVLAPNTAFIGKPFTTAALVQKVREVLDAPR